MKKIAFKIVLYIVRVLSLVLVTSLIAYMLMLFSPIDPVKEYLRDMGSAVTEEKARQIREYWGVDDPPVERYVNWLKGVTQGDFGDSLVYKRPVGELIKEKFSNSIVLMMTAWTLSGLFGFALGCWMGVFRDTWLDKSFRTLCLVLSSTPTFWLGILVLLLFAVQLKWFPVGLSMPVGVMDADVTFAQKLHHLILPAMTLSFASFANVALHTRQKLVDVMESDYVLFAKARGEGTWTILKRHGFRNIALPAITLQFASFSELFAGSVLAENVFSYPGLGSAITTAGLKSDVPMLLGATIFSAIFVITGNMLADIIYGLVDPQTRIGYIGH